MPVSLSSMVLHIGADTKDAESGLDRVNNHVGRMGGLVGITSLAFTGGMGAIASGVMEAGRALKGMLTNAEQAQACLLIHISEPTRLLSISYAVFCLKKK